MNAHGISSTLLCTDAIKAIFFSLSLTLLPVSLSSIPLSWFITRPIEKKSARILQLCSFLSRLFSSFSLFLFLHACVRLCMCSYFSFHCALIKYFTSETKKKDVCSCFLWEFNALFVDAQCEFAAILYSIHAFGCYFEQHHIIAIWIHVTNEHTCKRTTQNHSARKTYRERQKKRIKHL